MSVSRTCVGVFVFTIAATAHAEDRDGPMKSPAMVTTGVVTATVGSAAIAGGIGFLVLYTQEITVMALACPSCQPRTIARDNDYLIGGTLAVVGGALAILGSIPLLYVGAKHRSKVWVTASGIAGRF